MLRKLTTQRLKTAALVLAMTIALGGLALAQDGRYYDRSADGYGHERVRVGWDMGYQDGSKVARQDFDHRKPYDPYPRGKYAREDRGYRSEYGDKYAYMNQYARGYQQGYQQVFHRY